MLLTYNICTRTAQPQQIKKIHKQNQSNLRKQTSKRTSNKHDHTCNVKSLSSNWSSLVKKSAPIVALYWLLNFLLTNLNWSSLRQKPKSPVPTSIYIKSHATKLIKRIGDQRHHAEQYQIKRVITKIRIIKIKQKKWQRHNWILRILIHKWSLPNSVKPSSDIQTTEVNQPHQLKSNSQVIKRRERKGITITRYHQGW